MTAISPRVLANELAAQLDRVADFLVGGEHVAHMHNDHTIIGWTDGAGGHPVLRVENESLMDAVNAIAAIDGEASLPAIVSLFKNAGVKCERLA